MSTETSSEITLGSPATPSNWEKWVALPEGESFFREMASKVSSAVKAANDAHNFLDPSRQYKEGKPLFVDIDLNNSPKYHLQPGNNCIMVNDQAKTICTLDWSNAQKVEARATYGLTTYSTEVTLRPENNPKGINLEQTYTFQTGIDYVIVFSVIIGETGTLSTIEAKNMVIALNRNTSPGYVGFDFGMLMEPRDPSKELSKHETLWIQANEGETPCVTYSRKLTLKEITEEIRKVIDQIVTFLTPQPIVITSNTSSPHDSN